MGFALLDRSASVLDVLSQSSLKSKGGTGTDTVDLILRISLYSSISCSDERLPEDDVYP